MTVEAFNGDINLDLDLDLIKTFITKFKVVSEEEKLERFKSFFDKSKLELADVIKKGGKITADLSGGKDSRMVLSMVKSVDLLDKVRFHQFVVPPYVFDGKFKRLYNKLIIDRFISNEIRDDFDLKTRKLRPLDGLWIKGCCTLLGFLFKSFENEAKEFKFTKKDCECAKYIYDYFDDKNVAYCFYRYIVDISLDFLKAKNEQLPIKTPYVKGLLSDKKDLYDVFENLYEDMFFYKEITQYRTRDLYNFFSVNGFDEMLIYPFSDRKIDRKFLKEKGIEMKRLPYKIVVSPSEINQKERNWEM